MGEQSPGSPAHRLLRQSQGFEGLDPRVELLPALQSCRLGIVNTLGIDLIQIHSHSTDRPPPCEAQRQRSLSRVHDLHDLDAVRSPRGKKPVNPLLSGSAWP